MTVSSQVAKNIYTPAVPTTSFAIAPIDYNDDSTLKVFKGLTELTEGPDWSEDGTNVHLTTAATLGDTITLKRVTPKTQTKDVMDGDPVPVTVIENGLDRIVRQVQEVAADITTNVSLPVGYPLTSLVMPTPEANKFIKWNPTATALMNETIDLSTLQTSIGSLEDADTAMDIRMDAVEADIAQIDIDIAALSGQIAPLAGDISALQTDMGIAQADIVTNANNINALAVRTLSLETLLGGKGSQVILNNQLVDENLTALLFDGYINSSIIIDYEISRNTDTNYRTSVGTLYLVCRGNGVWTTERGLTVLDIDGVEFHISTSAGKIGQVSYISDDLAGTNYTGTFKYIIRKFEV